MTDAPRTYITTTIPYVNARPHLGFALELVQADVLARHRRQAGDDVRLLTGTDDNSLKNVIAAEAAGVGVQEFVDRNAVAFERLRDPLSLSFDDFIRTSSDPRHRVGVERLWQRVAEAGDLYRKHYEGLYCVGCEQFWTPEDLDGGNCPEHGTPPRPVAEENWFFRLSRHADTLRRLIGDGTLRIEPASRRNEVLGLIDGGLHDFSVSRSRTRARGWGIPVPGDDDQVVYVWWDALGNYVTSLGYGTGGEDFDRWWAGSGRRIHLVGKGVIRFHAVYWPAMLLSAGLPLPTDVLVHDYLTVEGRKISKSAGTVVDPADLVARYGTDAVRWWLLRDVPRVGDADFTAERLVQRHDTDLAGGVGNLVNRIVTMVHRYRAGRPPAVRGGDVPGVARVVGVARVGGIAAVSEWLARAVEESAGRVGSALEDYDFRQAAAAVWTVVEEANRCIDATRPWVHARAEKDGDRASAERLDDVLGALLASCLVLAERLTPFLPDAAARITAQCTPVDGVLPPPAPLFPRLSDTAARPAEAGQETGGQGTAGRRAVAGA
ncbi:methionine--tRNA ligase [Streptomyces sp. t39]|uniref:methionine--tRNA ligase n=1 Tax=Streptomyces sp. t39 TaxID=1828156 RepID=UPI0011CD8D6B|nr:methionine--tRNA ligase [Streptomyces sp. t39]TXS57495.1 methionine--tRNA ligase [Streptomyces sp. t39]